MAPAPGTLRVSILRRGLRICPSALYPRGQRMPALRGWSDARVKKTETAYCAARCGDIDFPICNRWGNELGP
jgi:hypothetical protein